MLGACGGGNGHRDGHPQSAFQPIQQRHHADGGHRPFSRSARRQRARSIIPNGRSGGHRLDQHCRPRRRSHGGAPADYGQDGTSQLGATQAPPLRLRAANTATIAFHPRRPIRFLSPALFVSSPKYLFVSASPLLIELYWYSNIYPTS